MKVVALFSLLSCLSLSVHVTAQETRLFVFGHSLIDHRPPLEATPSDETTVPHWLYLLYANVNLDFAAGGQYGFLPQHADLPPFSQWGYDIVPGVWESDVESFAEANISHSMITAANFAQWQGPDEEYPTDPGISPVSATIDIVDWLSEQNPDMRIYIYENWPDMAPYLSGDFPPSEEQLSNYYAYTEGDFHNWWLAYQDLVVESFENTNPKMIPVGPLISRIYEEILTGEINPGDLYEDDAPHGKPNIYFLSALICYRAFTNEDPVVDGLDLNLIHPSIQNNMDDIIKLIKEELAVFNFENDVSRVYYDDVVSIQDVPSQYELDVFPNPALTEVHVSAGKANGMLFIYNTLGQPVDQSPLINGKKSIDVSTLASGIYRLQLRDYEGNIWTAKWVKQ